jgi:hypothetical protein
MTESGNPAEIAAQELRLVRKTVGSFSSRSPAARARAPVAHASRPGLYSHRGRRLTKT